MSRYSQRVAGAVVLLMLASEARADVVISWRRTADGKPPRVTDLTETITLSKHREDQAPPGKSVNFASIRDLTTMKEYMLWPQFKLMSIGVLVTEKESDRQAAQRRRKESEREDPSEVAYEKAVEKRRDEARGTPTGATATIAGRLCREHRYTAVSYDSTFVLAGTYWIPDEGPGDDEYARYYKKVGGLRFVEKEEREANKASHEKATRGQGELRAEFMAVVRRRGIPHRFEFEITGKKTPALKLKLRQELLKISTEPVPASTFEIPKGYRIRK